MRIGVRIRIVRKRITGGDDVRGAVCGSGVAAKKELITDNASQTSYLIWVVMINLQSQADVDIG